MPTLCQGRIIWVEIPDSRGAVKRRPVVIITADDDIPTAEELVGIVCPHTSVHTDPRPADYIEIPHDPSGVCRTKLRKATVAVCRWTVRLTKSALESLDGADYGGTVSAIALEQIVDAALKYLSER